MVSPDVRDLLDYFVGNPSAVDDYTAARTPPHPDPSTATPPRWLEPPRYAPTGPGSLITTSDTRKGSRHHNLYSVESVDAVWDET